jgi:hypothetical protein
MAFNINEIQSQFKFEGARPTLFQVRITNPVNTSADSQVEFLAMATSIPASNLGNIPVPYFGRIINFAGDRTYDPWTVTIMNDEDFKIRNTLEEWSNAINRRVQNVRDPVIAANHAYKSTARVIQLAKTGEALRVYRFNGIYPATISDIGLDWSDRDQFERFQVQFVYDYWDIDGGSTGRAGVN